MDQPFAECQRINTLSNNPFSFMMTGKRTSENIVGKRENAGKPAFSLFPQCFLLFQKEHQRE